MNAQLLAELRELTPEEKKILEGPKVVDGDLYYLPKSHVVDSRKLLDSGKAMQIRTHTRIVHFPAHLPNLLQLIYIGSGHTTHKINGDLIKLREGELLFLNQNATQEIYPGGESHIEVNFIILPAFFDYALTMLGDDDNYIRDFLLDCLKSEHEDVSYLHFQVADVLPIQNLMENLIWTLHHEQVNKRSIHQVTMGLLLMHLMNVTDKVHVGRNQKEQELMMVVHRYVEAKARDGELSELAQMLHYDLHWLSRTIKRLTGKTYTELVQAKRMRQAAYLLQTSRLSVGDIALAVGYENISYFHRLFQKTYQMSPRKYRIRQREERT